MVIPKGRIYNNIVKLLSEAGIHLDLDERAYRPIVSDPDIEVKIMKPQNIPQLLEIGSHDIGFSGYDWVQETCSDVLELFDLNFDPVRIVAAIPQEKDFAEMRGRKIIVATEYEQVSRKYLDENGFDYRLLRTFGATEVFPPDDADMIIDNTSTGRTLVEHKLKIVATILKSSTRLIANKAVMDDSWKAEKIAGLQMLFGSILDARNKVMLEMNVPGDLLEAVIKVLPCMRAPTVSSLFGDQGYAVKAAIPRNQAAQIILQLKSMGASDILEYEFKKVVA